MAFYNYLYRTFCSIFRKNEHFDQAIEVLYNEEDERWITADWFLTNSCNYKCSYCHPSLNAGTRWPDFERVKTFLTNFSSYAADQNKNSFITFSGGEVAALPYFFDLVKLNSELKIKPMYVTNLSLPLSFWKEIPTGPMIIISSFHALMTSKEDFFEKLKYFETRNDIQMCADIMLIPSMFDELYEFALKLTKVLKTTGVNVIPLQDNFSQAGSQRSLQYSDEQLKMIEDFPRKNEGKGGYFPRTNGLMKLNNKKLVSFFPGELIFCGKNLFKNWTCEAGKKQFSVDLDENIWRCQWKEAGKIGELSNFDFQSLRKLAPVVCLSEKCFGFHDITAPKKK